MIKSHNNSIAIVIPKLKWYRIKRYFGNYWLRRLTRRTTVNRSWSKTPDGSCMFTVGTYPCEWEDCGVRKEGHQPPYRLYMCIHCKFRHEEPIDA